MIRQRREVSPSHFAIAHAVVPPRLTFLGFRGPRGNASARSIDAAALAAERHRWAASPDYGISRPPLYAEKGRMRLCRNFCVGRRTTPSHIEAVNENSSTAYVKITFVVNEWEGRPITRYLSEIRIYMLLYIPWHPAETRPGSTEY